MIHSSLAINNVVFLSYFAHIEMNRTYHETIDYLFSKLPMFSRVGAAAYKADITNTVELCDFIGTPQLSFKSVHIAGTNGKGSVSHMLAAIFQQAGYKTGLYTSPHLKDFRERIKIDGVMIPKQKVIDFCEKTEEITQKISPSFFELTVAMAFEHFAEEKVDIAIIETGLGGRLDSTNIITPILSIITNIGFDHMNLLGNTLEKIALEKAGIIKEQVPVVIGETLKETKEIFIREALKKAAPITFAEERFEITKADQIGDKLEISLSGHNSSMNYFCDLAGLYQQKNIRTVITAIDILRNTFSLSEEDIVIALSKTKALNGLHGRWEVLQHHPKIVLDVAHNEDGAKQLKEQLSLCNYKNLHVVFGMVKDKQIDTVLSLLPKNALYYFTKAHIPRALNENELKVLASGYDLKGDCFQEVNIALNAAIKNASRDDLILVTGSVFLVGEVNIPIPS